jgi:hypothetical protein
MPRIRIVDAAADEAAERDMGRVLRDARAFELARASLLAEGVAPTTAAVRQRVLWGIVYTCLSYEAEDAGEEPPHGVILARSERQVPRRRARLRMRSMRREACARCRSRGKGGRLIFAERK